MSLLSWIFTLLVGFGGRELGCGRLLQLVQALTCSQWSTPSEQGLFQDGDVVVGGLFNLHYKPPDTAHNFTQQPNYKACTGWSCNTSCNLCKLLWLISPNSTFTVRFSSFLISGWKTFLCSTYMPWCLQWRRSITAQRCCQAWSWGSTFGIAAPSIPGPRRQHCRWLEETMPAVIFQPHRTTLLRLLKKKVLIKHRNAWLSHICFKMTYWNSRCRLGSFDYWRCFV